MIIMEEKPWKTAYVFGMTCFFFKKKIHSSSSNYQQKYFCVLTCALLVNKTTRSLAKKKKKTEREGGGIFTHQLNHILTTLCYIFVGCKHSKELDTFFSFNLLGLEFFKKLGTSSSPYSEHVI